MFKVTIMSNNRRETKLVPGETTPATLIADFGGGNMAYSLSSHPLNADMMNTPIAALAETFGLGETLFLASVAKTQNA